MHQDTNGRNTGTNCRNSTPFSCNRNRGLDAINICNSITMTQSSSANGGSGGNGGSNGNASSSASASAAAADRGGTAIAANTEIIGSESEDTAAETAQPAGQEENLLQADPSASASATSGAATIGSAGAGGAGGAGGVSANSATAEINNVVVLSYGGSGAAPGFQIGLNEKKLDIRIDEDGTAYVNGKKMKESQLENGTKVFIFNDSQSFNPETK